MVKKTKRGDVNFSNRSLGKLENQNAHVMMTSRSVPSRFILRPGQRGMYTLLFIKLIMNGPLEFKAIVYITYFDSIESFQQLVYISHNPN